MTTIQARRQLIVIVLLCIAVVAAIVRHNAVPGSTTRDVSSVLMMLWLPVIGSIVGWCYGRLRRPAPAPAAPAGFVPEQPFQPHALVELTLRPPLLPVEDVPVQIGEHRCVLVVDNQGFQARWQVPAGLTVRRGETHRLPIEFLTPQIALTRLPHGTAFRLLVGEAFVGDGKMVQTFGATVPA